MKLSIVLISFLLALGLGLYTSQSQPSSQPSPQPSPQSSPPPSVLHQTYDLPGAVVHLIKIPQHEQYTLRPMVADGLMTVEEFAQKTSVQPIAVINAGFFDPVNQQTTSHIRINGQVQADPRKNTRLVDNPDLNRYLPKILNRSEFRQYQCGTQVKYAITSHQHPIPKDCKLNYSLGAGPQLLPQLTLQAEAFTDSVDGQVIRDAIGSRQPNARSAIGLTQSGDLLWVMVEQQSLDKPGLSLPELADFLKQQGATQALNLDGGGSSALVYQGKTYPGRPGSAGESAVRPVKSVCVLQEQQTP
ncbi:phosphodiester glycosidase family protein [Acaryochloris sp. IP29b_bin.148]|uniref:phosphodiester glycosidase family protein n=1 Tax=Acaryochloris sp. IP29b_bin.148 TaxID=2969218 RepID=UPI00262A3592|nr:phosphodiester glycosidase family protein [Acaryochloris sp. IP29b_bin.148]